MTSRWANPVNNNRLYDLEGNLLAGGTVEFYEAGTSTPLAVYSDEDLTSSLGSELTADAYGLLPDFHMASGTKYKAIAKDSAGVTKWTRDDIWSLDSAIDARLDGLTETVNSLGVARNSIQNAACFVLRRDTFGQPVTAPTISASFQQGRLAGHYAKATDSSAGTITRGTTTDIEAGYYLALSSVTTTDASSAAVAQFRVNAGDAGRFANGSGTFTCWVYQDTGVEKNYTITFKKADAENDFSSTTTIKASAATAVASGTWTELTFTHAAFGDCRNGIAIEVSCACGVQTTKNYYFSMPHLDVGETATAWNSEPAENDEAGLLFKPRQYPPDYLSGLTLSQAADADHDITVAVGSARSDADDGNIDLTSAITKQLDAAWAEGTNAGGLPSGVTLSGDEWLYFFVIGKDDGTVDAGFDDNAAATNLLADASAYNYYRHVGTVYLNASSNIGGHFSIANLGLRVDSVTLFTSTTLQPPPGATVYKGVLLQGAGGAGEAAALGSDGGDTTIDAVFVAGGGKRGEVAAGGLGGTGSLASYDPDTIAAYLVEIVSGMDGQIGSGGGNTGYGGEAGFMMSADPGWIGETGGDFTDSADGSGGGGGAGNNSNWNGGGGGAAVYLRNYPATAALTVTIGAGGTNANAGDGGDGFVRLEF